MQCVLDVALVIFCTDTSSASQWIQPTTSTLIRNDYDISAGLHNKSIYLLGGNENRRQVTEYIISEDTFIDHGTPLGSDVQGYAQYWTQIDHLLYIKDRNSDTIVIFDMKTKTFTANYIPNVPQNTGVYACLASSQTQLFILGGTYDTINDVSVYDLSTTQWLSNVPPMQSSRSSSACIVHPTTNALYAIAGFISTNGVTSSIETIEINDIHLKTWTYIQPLSQPLAWPRCVMHKSTIYVIGGGISGAGSATTKVHIINALTNEVTVSPDTTPLALTEVAPIVVDDMIFVFGGYSYSTGAVDTWMSYDLHMLSDKVLINFYSCPK